MRETASLPEESEAVTSGEGSEHVDLLSQTSANGSSPKKNRSDSFRTQNEMGTHAFLTLEEKRRLNEGDYIARPKDSSMLSLLSVRCK